ncbi:hypothetical protein PICST_80533 [Scheffersomyces stipitis CBS 6054]|uniref:TOG domain-containing protein n=1 Tax=Scheffersomyces stipitis (strain ATCC 58785 / CBS 6054 / NBRC 10063 / NRRL Y-11545) TaxID=322104 RepID=A3GGY8_PICST|nr:predicted protein [Scheffersomyces stipitis CBS 6054]EAZ63615.2 hypothetical protein PICST_80533 [Scheffersomyces stipitis CBS 6054]
MSEEPDYSSLPLEERLVHKVWKVRLEAYEETRTQIESSRNENDVCFQNFNSHPELFKQIVTDSNVVAQESGLKLLVNYLQFGGTASIANRLKSAGAIPAICKKGLTSSRKNTKDFAIELLLLFVELSKDVNSVIEDILPLLTDRLPKLVAGSVNALAVIVNNYGCQVVSPKPIIPYLAKLFAHADKNVRAETTQLTVELYKWMGDALVKILLQELKPVQQKDLSKAFEAVKDAPEQKRYTRSQQLEIKRREEEEAAAAAATVSASTVTKDDMDIDMVDSESSIRANAVAFDPFDLAEPVDVLSKFPVDLDERIGSAKWKDRKEVLDEVLESLNSVVKVVPTADYTHFFRIIAKCMKDANIQVVENAANSAEIVIKGLQGSFPKYKHILLMPMVERTKEKKASVATALENALTAIFDATSLSDILEESIAGMKLKVPQNKIAAASFLQKCLVSSKIPPTSAEVDSIMEIGVKLLGESQEPIRQASTEMIGTLMKITGERELKSFLEKIDANRKSKIQAFFEKVDVNSKLGSSSGPSQRSGSFQPAASVTRATRPPSQVGEKKLTSGGARRLVPTSSSIPSKRGATSPVKRSDDVPKVSALGRGLTARSLASSHVPAPAHPAPTRASHDNSLSEEDRAELNELRKEKEKWLDDRARESQRLQQVETENATLKLELNQLKSTADNYVRDHNNSLLMIQQKETQISRLNNDLEDAKQKIRFLEQEIEMMNLQQKPPSFEPKTAASVGTPEKQRSRITSGELSSGVKRLSIGGDIFKESPYNKSSSISNRITSPSRMSTITNTFKDSSTSVSSELDTSDDWKRAAEVTSQLKARIEKMKARSRMGQPL